MSLWHCYDSLSGESFEVNGSDEDEIIVAVEDYIRDGIDSDTGSVGYDVTATAVDGSEFVITGEVSPAAE